MKTKRTLSRDAMRAHLEKAGVKHPQWHAWTTPTTGDVTLKQCTVATHPGLSEMRTQVPFNDGVPAHHFPAGYQHAPRVIAFSCN